MNIQQALSDATQKLSTNSNSAYLDSQVLLCHLLQCSSAYLLTWPEQELNTTQFKAFFALIKQRQQGQPVAHLTGKREFWSLAFAVNNTTLIPRPETETLVEFVLTNFKTQKTLKLLDMGTGSGIIAISLATQKPNWHIFASDISAPALQLAKQNSQHHQTSQIQFIESNWFEKITEKSFDIIISNPPYIAEDDLHLNIGDVKFEPKSALISGKVGLDDIKHLCAHAKDFLNKKGVLILEHGYNQAPQVQSCLAENGYQHIQQVTDLAGHIRLSAGTYTT